MIPVFSANLTSVGGMVSVGVRVLLHVQVEESSRVDITAMLMKALKVIGMSLTPTNNERQSAALLQAPDIHSKVML